MIRDTFVVAFRIRPIGAIGINQFYDFTPHIRTVSINRGKSSTFGTFPVSTVVIELNNQNRTFDPTLTSTQIGERNSFDGLGNPTITPIMWNPQQQMSQRKVVEIGYGVFDESLGVRTKVGFDFGPLAFQGYTYDWNLSYAVDGQSIATLTLHDFSGLWSRIFLDAETPVAETSGERFFDIYNTYKTPGTPFSNLGASIDIGTVDLGTQPVAAGTPLLDYLNLIAETEGGYSFQTREGRQRFKQRVSPSGSDYLSLGLDGIGITSISASYGTELLYNRIKVQNIGGSVIQVDDENSQDLNGVRELDLTGLLGANDDEALSLATFLATNYSTAQLRFDEVEVSVSKYDEGDDISETQEKLVTAEIGDFVEVSYRPNNTGDTIVQNKRIIGIRHRITPNDYFMSFALDDVRQYSLILDDEIFGKLDVYRLA